MLIFLSGNVVELQNGENNTKLQKLSNPKSFFVSGAFLFSFDGPAMQE
jgi:hypothetical protein